MEFHSWILFFYLGAVVMRPAAPQNTKPRVTAKCPIGSLAKACSIITRAAKIYNELIR